MMSLPKISVCWGQILNSFSLLKCEKEQICQNSSLTGRDHQLSTSNFLASQWTQSLNFYTLTTIPFVGWVGEGHGGGSGASVAEEDKLRF